MECVCECVVGYLDKRMGVERAWCGCWSSRRLMKMEDMFVEGRKKGKRGKCGYWSSIWRVDGMRKRAECG